jgi:predicted Zn-dependent protease
MKPKCLIAIICFLLFLPLKVFGLTLEEEKKYGREIYLEIARSSALNNDPFVALYLRTIKDRLEAVASIPFPIVLTIIESQSVNAFATVGGYVFVTTGLIGLCDNEQELAGVLAHEFTHIGRRHVAKSLEKQKYINVGMLATMALSMLVGARESAATLAAGMGAAQAMSLKYTREDEEEADRGGSTTADRAGYGGLGIAEFLKRLKITEGDKEVPQYLLTHPYHEERIIKVESMWAGSKVTVDTSFFPYLLVRVKILHKPPGAGVDDMWINRYLKDKSNPVNAYAASMIYSLKGNVSESINIAKDMKAPFKNLLLGELLLDANRFKDAIDILKDESEPVSRFFLAKAYEGYGDRAMAANIFKELVQYGNSYPEIFNRLGMALGRMGQEAGGYEYLGRYYLEIGRQDLARNYLEKAVAKYGINSKEAKEILKILDELKEKKGNR